MLSDRARRRPPLLAIAAFAGIGVPGVTLLLFHFEGWNLPTWLAVGLPIILIGSSRGTAVLLGWKAIRWATPRVKALRRRSAGPDDAAQEGS